MGVVADTVHVLAIPYPAQGHINPMLDICMHLVGSGFSVTFVNTDHTHARIFQSRPPEVLDCFEQLGIHLVHIPGGSPPEMHGYRNGSEVAILSSTLLEGPFEQLLSSLQQEGLPVAVVLADALLGWTQRVAERFGLPRVAFWPSSAATLSALFHFSELVAQDVSRLFPGKSGDCVEKILIPDIPGLPPTKPSELPLASKLIDGEITEHTRLVAEQFLVLPQTSFVLLNSFPALEGPVLDALSSKFSVRSIGPILPSEYLSGESEAKKLIRTSLFLEDGACLEWLDKQNPGSVLYISFGSISVRSNDQLLELALGLESSGRPFLWVIRSYPADADAFSEAFREFMERTREQGKVVPWAPQLQVLSHRAVGGFMTHCGWNSVTESVAMGVPMLCWADTGERKANQNIAVRDMGVGMQMRQDTAAASRSEVMNREEVEMVVREFMDGEKTSSMRGRAAELRRSALSAAASDHLQEFIASMKKISVARHASSQNPSFVV